MSGINKVFLLGNLGQDPDVRYTNGGAAIANLSVATGESWKDKESGEWKEKTEWHRVVLFGRTAEVARDYLKKGARVHIEGKLQTRKWQDGDGNDRYITEIVGGNMLMLSEKEGQGAGTGNRNPARDEGRQEQPQTTRHKEQAARQEFVDDEIPF